LTFVATVVAPSRALLRCGWPARGISAQQVLLAAAAAKHWE
jgi:hypothetical protein